MSLSVENQPEQSRYALLQDGELIGVAEYDVNDEAIVFTHTEVDEAKREKGMASTLDSSGARRCARQLGPTGDRLLPLRTELAQRAP